MLGRVNEFELACDPQGFGGFKRLIERSQLVCVEIVAHDRDPVRLGIAPVIDQLLYLASPIHAGAVVGRSHAPPPGQRLHKHPHRAMQTTGRRGS